MKKLNFKTVLVVLLMLVVSGTSSCLAACDLKNKTYGERVSRIMKMLVPKTPEDKRFIRVGRDNDGGYIMIDDFKENTVAYSIGISDDISWDQEMAKKGIDVFMYDHTIAPLKVSGHLKFFKTGVCGLNSKAPNLLTLEEMLTKDENTSKNNIILKMDVEDAEWDTFNTVPDDVLKKFSQIVVEFHGLCRRSKDKSSYNEVIKVLEKLNNNHQIIHVHANNYGKYEIVGGMPVANVIEVTYLRKDNYKFLNKSSEEAKSLDMPNHANNPEYILCLEEFRN